MATYEKELHVTKTDAYSLTIPAGWLGDETITSHTVTVDSKVTMGISSVTDNVIAVLLTGVEEGSSNIHFDYTTATRSDCNKVIVRVIATC